MLLLLLLCFILDMQITLDLRRCFLSGDWPGFEGAVERGRKVIADLGGGEAVEGSPDSGTGLPPQCSVEFRLAENEVEDKKVAKYVHSLHMCDPHHDSEGPQCGASMCASLPLVCVATHAPTGSWCQALGKAPCRVSWVSCTSLALMLGR